MGVQILTTTDTNTYTTLSLNLSFLYIFIWASQIMEASQSKAKSPTPQPSTALTCNFTHLLRRGTGPDDVCAVETLGLHREVSWLASHPLTEEVASVLLNLLEYFH